MGFLNSTVDLHIHGGPDNVPRKQTELEIAKDALESGMRSVVFKSHVRSTVSSSNAINKTLGKEIAYGSLVLNDFIGFDLSKVKEEIEKGAKIVYMPTLSVGKLGILDGRGEIKDEVKKVLRLIAKEDVALATGHLSKEEVLSLVPEAKKVGIRKIIITHPDLEVSHLSTENQKELNKYGVYFERTYYCALQSEEKFKEIVKNIRETGVENNIVSSDLGQPKNPKPVDGFKEFLERLLMAGFTECEVMVMAKLNPLKILNLMDEFVIEFVREYVKRGEFRQKTRYRGPVIGFARASDPEFLKLKKIVRQSHKLPQDLLPNAETVVSIFLPFSETIVDGNAKGNRPSKAWSVAYTETNELLDRLTEDLAKELEKASYASVGIKSTHHLSHAKKDHYDESELYSDWSQKHVAEIAGVGKGGVNKLIITRQGCAGRLGSLVTSIKLTPSEKEASEYCLTKRGLKCNKCISRCPVRAISVDSFDRNACMEYLVKQRKFQEKNFKDIIATQTCGKCCCGVPCSTQIP